MQLIDPPSPPHTPPGPQLCRESWHDRPGEVETPGCGREFLPEGTHLGGSH